jgi:PsbP
MQDSTESAEVLSQNTRDVKEGTKLFEIEYELNSTRGRKRIVNAVTIASSKLYIVNAQHKCLKESCSIRDEIAIQALRDSVATFELLD